MDALNLEASSDTPRIILDSVSNIFEISDRSFPEDAIAFYLPILDWLSLYISKPNQVTTFRFNLEYYNTASAKQVFKILSLLEKLSKEKEVYINWCYNKEDRDMLASGERFSNLFELKFNMLEN